MSDLIRPVVYVMGLLIVALGFFMLVPLVVDFLDGSENWQSFFISAVLCVFVGGGVSLATANTLRSAMSLRQAFLLTFFAWSIIPAFGAIPFVLGELHLSLTDAYFESVSGITTTGATVITGLDDLSLGTNLWRAILHWLGGLGIVIVAMLFLPVMKVGGMQFFRSEGFDTLGKIMPRALDISTELLKLYVFLTILCIFTFLILGMGNYDAVIHAFSTVSTGGFAGYDGSFSEFSSSLQYAAVVFMILASMPFVRFIQLAQGSVLPLWKDQQVRAYLRWILYATFLIILYRVAVQGGVLSQQTFRESLFMVVSVFSGTGFSNADVPSWGSFSLVILIIVGLIGGCTSSTGCSVKVFRYLILFEAIKVQARRFKNPSAIVSMRYEERNIPQEVVDSVMAFFGLFIMTFGILSLALYLAGLEMSTAITGAWTSIANIGPVFGAEVGKSGAVDGFPVVAKWLMSIGMFVGRLEIFTVYLLLMRSFWRD